MSNANSKAAIEVALTLLESFPHDALAAHLGRLDRLARGVREAGADASCGGGGRGAILDAVLPNDLGGARVAGANGHGGGGGGDAPPIIMNAVLSNDHLLGIILGFDGSLAFYHKHYRWLVGYGSPLPVASGYFNVTNAKILVCKRWKSMVMGQEGMDQWRSQSKAQVERDIEIATNAAKDQSLSWTARICAMAIANDVAALEAAFQDATDEKFGVGAAMKEQRAKGSDDDYYDLIDRDFQPVPPGHSFYRLCMWDLVEDIHDEGELLYSFTTSVAYAAASVGSLEALQMLGSRESFPLWHRYFDEKGVGFLGSLVSRACSNPTLDCIVQSISAILSNQSIEGYLDENALHLRHRGFNGNHLHLAAGRGHAGLVKALIEGGMNPNRRCECIDSRSFKRVDDYYGGYDDDYDDSDASSTGVIIDERDRGVKQYPLPEDWASIRGHDVVVQLIHDLNSPSRYGTSRGMSDGVKRGCAKRFNTGRGFGFIKPDGGLHRGGKDVFVHISDIEDGMPLVENEVVEFTTEITSRGTRAVGVTRVKSRW